ncbi:MAG: AAA family ATPase [Bryobacterales bacterium]|nr:AAA family ATPase [Bryobacterales bacterium]
MPVVALLNQKGGVGKTTLSIHIAAELAANARVLLIDADQQGSALDWAAQREASAGFSVIGFPKPVLHREIAALGNGYDWVLIDGPPRVNELARSAIAASDMVLIPVQPSPFDVWAAKDIIDIVKEFSIPKPNLETRFLINRLFPNTMLGAEIQEALASFDVPVLANAIRNRTEYAKAARAGLTALETEPYGQAAREIRAVVEEFTALLNGAKEVKKIHVAS